MHTMGHRSERLAQEETITVTEARDFVIYDWLKSGDVSPLAYWLLDGHEPGDLIRRTLGRMLLGEQSKEQLPDCPDRVYRLVIKAHSSKGRPRNRANETRDRLLAENVYKLRREGVPYDAASKPFFKTYDTVAAQSGSKQFETRTTKGTVRNPAFN
jgi:hypothetical protein